MKFRLAGFDACRNCTVILLRNPTRKFAFWIHLTTTLLTEDFNHKLRQYVPEQLLQWRDFCHDAALDEP